MSSRLALVRDGLLQLISVFMLSPVCLAGASGLGFSWFIWAFEGFVLFFCILHLIGDLSPTAIRSIQCVFVRYDQLPGLSVYACLKDCLFPVMYY